MKKIFYYLFLLLGCFANCFAGETSINNETTLTLHVATPGTLSDLIFDAGTRPINVAKLTLTGTLNDADFTCMRETMTSLVDVDLSGITNTSGVDFDGKRNLVRIILPTNLTSIGDWAFGGCSALTSITIPNSVTSIGELVFQGCSSLTSMNVENGNTHYDSRENCNAIIETATNTLIAGCQNTIIPNSVTSIGDGAFADCSSLTSITIPNSVTNIGEWAFCSCDALTFVTIPNSVTSIAYAAFWGCSSLTTVTIPNSVTSIGNCAFEGCSALTSITIGNRVTSIGEQAFDSCSSLTSVTIPNSVTSIGDWAFVGCSSLKTVICEAIEVPELLGSYVFYDMPLSEATLYVPAQSLDDYKAAEQWKEFGTILTLDKAPSAVDNISSPSANTRKLLRNGQLIIVRDGIEYNAMGQEL